jgi:hypothetical protein
MRRWVVGIAGIAVLLWGSTPYAHGQRATEMFIPLGQSPGLSGKVTVMGKIETIQAKDRTIAIAGPSGSLTAKITDRTKIWLDRSRLKLTNQTGTFGDLKKDQTVEVLYEGAERKDKAAADWIKVQITEPGSASGAKPAN